MSKKKINTLKFINGVNVKSALNSALADQGFKCVQVSIRHKKTDHLVLDMTLVELKNRTIEIDQAKELMRAVASMAGVYWLDCQLAIAEALDGEGGPHLDWVMAQYEILKKEQC